MTKNDWKEQVRAAGRAHLKDFLLAAKKHGTIYYAIPHVAKSGMSRTIVLATIATRGRKPYLLNYWPSYDLPAGAQDTYSAGLDVVCKDLGFDFKRRGFDASIAGMDAVFWLVQRLARLAGFDPPAAFANALKREAMF